MPLVWKALAERLGTFLFDWKQNENVQQLTLIHLHCMHGLNLNGNSCMVQIVVFTCCVHLHMTSHKI